MMEDQFYMVLPSNSSMDLYPNNTTACFTVKLPQEMRLKGEWEVGLAEIHYPLTFLHLAEKDATIFFTSTVYNSCPVCKVSHGLFKNLDDFLSRINKDLNQHKVFIFRNATKQGYISLNCGAEQISPGVIKPSRKFLKILGLENHPNLTEKGLYITKDVNGKGDVTGERPASILNALPRQIFIYTDITEPLIVGDVKTSLLRIVPVSLKDYKFGHNYYQTFAPIKAIPLLNTNFSAITIDTRDETGETIPFEFGTLTVTLHFRRKKK